MKNLAAFDFDHTIINKNSDTAIADLLNDNEIPLKLKELHKIDGWTQYMQGIFDILFSKGVTENVINSTIRSLSPTEGMIEVIDELFYKLNCDIIIISDSNSYFIDNWLKHYDLNNKILRVFTNPAQFVNGALKIEMYHFQDYCDLSTKNLCKGQILLDFIDNQKEINVTYNKVLYFGDGGNDLCPILKLSIQDLAFIRENYKCHELVKQIQDGNFQNKGESKKELKAEVITWNDGSDILKYLKSHID